MNVSYLHNKKFIQFIEILLPQVIKMKKLFSLCLYVKNVDSDTSSLYVYMTYCYPIYSVLTLFTRLLTYLAWNTIGQYLCFMQEIQIS